MSSASTACEETCTERHTWTYTRACARMIQTQIRSICIRYTIPLTHQGHAPDLPLCGVAVQNHLCLVSHVITRPRTACVPDCFLSLLVTIAAPSATGRVTATLSSSSSSTPTDSQAMRFRKSGRAREDRGRRMKDVRTELGYVEDVDWKNRKRKGQRHTADVYVLFEESVVLSCRWTKEKAASKCIAEDERR